MEKTMNEEMKRLLAEKERQDRELARIKDQLRALGDVRIVVPQSYFEEMEEVCTVRPSAPASAGPRGTALRG
jgi:hypothetical protein